LLFENGGFEQALAQAVEDSDLRARLGAAARATLIRRDFTWAGNARRVEAIAQNLLEKAR
jgi:glycosyltransferase involved in cell wall biosynthesis